MFFAIRLDRVSPYQPKLRSWRSSFSLWEKVRVRASDNIVVNPLEFGPR
jgi:hypothetical protein